MAGTSRLRRIGAARRAVATLALAATIATPAAAQRTGTRIGTTATAADGRDVAQMMADCWVERQPARARKWMDIVPGDAAEGAFFTDLREFETCLTSDRMVMDDKAIRFRYAQLRRPVAIKLAKDALRRQPSPPPPPAGPALAWFAGRTPADGRYDAAAVSMQEFGQCIATADWPHSVAMLRAIPDSPDEIAAFRALVPSLGGCVPDNQQVTLTRVLIREVLAEPVYHLIAPR